jgi:hypothetical protein
MSKSSQLLERLKSKPGYNKFIDANPDAFLYAMFCIVSANEKEGDKIQFDFYIPKEKKISYSEYPFDEIKVQNQTTEFVPKPINIENFKIDVEDLWNVVEKIQNEQNDKCIINKIIAIFKEDCLDLTCMSANLDILKMKVNHLTGEFISYKKENLTNFVQVRKGEKK